MLGLFWVEAWTVVMELPGTVVWQRVVVYTCLACFVAVHSLVVLAENGHARIPLWIGSRLARRGKQPYSSHDALSGRSQSSFLRKLGIVADDAG